MENPVGDGIKIASPAIVCGGTLTVNFLCPLKVQSSCPPTTLLFCRKRGIVEHTFYRWKAKFGGMEVSDAKRLRELEDENRKLKHMVADLMLDNRMLEDINSKKW
jgi:putative transposase